MERGRRVHNINTTLRMQHRHHHIKPLSIHLLDEGLSIPFPRQSVLDILLPCNRSAEVIYFISSRVYVLVGYHPWVSSPLLGMSMYCLEGELCNRPKSIFLALMTCKMSRTLRLLLTHPFFGRTHQSFPLPCFFEQLLGDAPRLWLISRVSDA